MKNDKLAELKKYQLKVAQLEKEVGRSQRRLLGLPGKMGYRSMDDLIDALRQASAGSGSAARSSGGRRKRAKITPEMKQKLKSLVQSGKTGSEIAHELGISEPSVHNIKKELGLVKKRK